MDQPTENNDPILVILMRNDLDSMNPGKACAQASHAANQMVHNIEHIIVDNTAELAMLQEWQSETWMGFGTVHVRAGWWEKIDEYLKDMEDELDAGGVVYGRVFDPTYPIRDGNITHYVPVYSCAYAFGPRSALAALEATFGFMP